MHDRQYGFCLPEVFLHLSLREGIHSQSSTVRQRLMPSTFQKHLIECDKYVFLTNLNGTNRQISIVLNGSSFFLLYLAVVPHRSVVALNIFQPKALFTVILTVVLLTTTFNYLGYLSLLN